MKYTFERNHDFRAFGFGFCISALGGDGLAVGVSLGFWSFIVDVSL